MDVILLDTAKDTNNDHHVDEWICNQDVDECDYVWKTSGTNHYSGVSAWNSATSGAPVAFGWSAAGHLYKAAGNSLYDLSGGEIGGSYRGALEISNPSYQTGDVLALDIGSPCGTTGNPYGTCISEYASSSWGEWESNKAGVAQLTQDVVGNATSLWALDSSGVIWGYTESSNTWSDGATTLPNCAGGTINAGQFVVNDSQLYMLAGTATGPGAVYGFSLLGNCWGVSPTPSGLDANWAYSITAPAVETYTSSNGILWATDSGGDIWELY
jgi:hypothetical protein